MTHKKPSATNKPERPVTANPVKPPTERQARPATSEVAREKQLVNLAVELAEKQLRDGTASAAVITHYLKLGTEKEKLERVILEKQSQLIQAKAENIHKGVEMEQLTKAAMEAMKSYAAK